MSSIAVLTRPLSATRWFRRVDRGVAALVVAFAAFAFVTALRLSAALDTIFWYGDFPEAPRLSDAVAHAAWGAGMHLPLQSGVGPLFVAGILERVTGAGWTAPALGAAMAVAAVAFMARTALLVFGPRGAVITAVVALAAPPVVAWELLSPVAHTSTVLVTAVAAWEVVLIARSPEQRHPVASLVAGAIAGVGIISDPLAVAAAALPWGVAMLALARRQPALWQEMATTAGVALGCASATVLLMAHAGISVVATQQTPFSVAGMADGVVAGVRTTLVTLGQMLTGVWYGAGWSQVLEVLGVVALAALTALPLRALRQPGAIRVFTLYWLVSAVSLIAALCLSGEAVTTAPIDTQGHYVDGIWYAMAALLPLGLLQRRAVRSITMATAVALVLISARGTTGMPATPFNGPDYADGPALETVLASLHLSRGYGGYWESYGVAWHSGGRITVLPLQQCGGGDAAPRLCRYLFAPNAWYLAQNGPVFVVATRDPCVDDDLCVDTSALERFGAPEQSIAVGHLVVEVYARDVFAALPAASQL